MIAIRTRGANGNDPEYGPVSATTHLWEGKTTVYGSDPEGHPEHAWQVSQQICVFRKDDFEAGPNCWTATDHGKIPHFEHDQAGDQVWTTATGIDRAGCAVAAGKVERMLVVRWSMRVGDPLGLLVATGAPTGVRAGTHPPRYVGVKRCRTCHEKQAIRHPVPEDSDPTGEGEAN